MATETTFTSTSLQVGSQKIDNTHEHLESCRTRARLRLKQPLRSQQQAHRKIKTTNKELRSLSTVNFKSMQPFETFKKITTYELNFLVVLVCLSLIKLTFANQLQNEQQQQQQPYHSHPHQQIKRIFNHLGRINQQVQQNDPHSHHLAHLMSLAEQQNPTEEHLGRQDRFDVDASQPDRGAFNRHSLQSLPLIDGEQKQSSFWTNNDMFVSSPTSNNRPYVDQFTEANVYAQNQQQQQQQQHQARYFAYRPLPVAPQTTSNDPPTTPSLSRQIMGPPQFYELAFSPTNAVQLEQVNSEDREANVAAAAAANSDGSVSGPIGATSSLRINNGRSMTNGPNNQAASDNQADSSNTSPVIARNTNQQVGSEQVNSKEQNDLPAKAQQDEQANNNNGEDNMSNGTNKGPNQEQSSHQQVVDKTIEPRQRRRIFNRILKKAEWNHLFVELSKVFLRYFLDLALKDIIGKQSGSTDTTTSRKKLDAQSELTDLLKDFVKTAISNI